MTAEADVVSTLNRSCVDLTSALTRLSAIKVGSTIEEATAGILDNLSDARGEIAKTAEAISVALIETEETMSAKVAQSGHACDEMIASTNSLASTTQAATDQIEESKTQLCERCETCVEVFAERRDALLDATESLFSSFSDVTYEGVENAEDRLTSMMRESCEALNGRVADELQTNFEELANLSEQCANDLQDGLSRLHEEFIQRCEGALEEIRQYVEEEIRANMEDLGSRFIDEAVDTLKEEVLKGFIASQAATALSTALAPLTPQLLTVKPLVPPAKAILESMP